MPARSLRHRHPALAHERDRVLELHHSRRGQCGELADRVPDDEVRVDPAASHGGEHGEARRDERRLLQLRVEQVLDRVVETDLLEVQPGGGAAGFVDGHRLGHGLGDVASHPGLVRALAREHEGDLAHAATPP